MFNISKNTINNLNNKQENSIKNDFHDLNWNKTLNFDNLEDVTQFLIEDITFLIQRGQITVPCASKFKLWIFNAIVVGK